MDALPAHPPLAPAQLWPLTLASILNERNHDDHDVLGGALRPRHAARATQILATGWDVRTPGEALSALEWLFESGHRTSYAQDGLGSAESFAAWDWCRAANVAGWAFVAYLVDRDTAWERMLRAARAAQGTYTSFEEMGQAYLRGMRVWAGGEDDPRVKTSEEAFAKLSADPAGPYRLAWRTSLEGAPAPEVAQKVEVVEPGGSIADAVARVGSGGRVVVGAGHYKGSLTPPHSVEIVARGDGEVIVEAEGRPALWAKAEVREGVARAISVAVRGLTIVAGRSAEDKTLNGVSVPGGFLRLHECVVRATHHGVSVRDGGVLHLSRTVVDACGQNAIWCEGGSVAVVHSELRAPAQNGAYLAQGHFTNVFEDSNIRSAAQVAIVAKAETRVRRCLIDAPGRCGVAVQAPVTLLDSTVKGSSGWGIAVENGGNVVLKGSRVEGATGANVDVKEGMVEMRDSVIANGVSSGLILQGGARALLVDSRLEDNAQGNLYAVPGATLFAARMKVSGAAVGVFLQNASAAIVASEVSSTEGHALDVRGEIAPVIMGSTIQGGIALAAGAHVCVVESRLDGEQTLGDGAGVEVIDAPQAQRAVDRTRAAVEGRADDGEDPNLN